MKMLKFISWRKRSSRLEPPAVHIDQANSTSSVHNDQADSTPSVHIDEADSSPNVPIDQTDSYSPPTLKTQKNLVSVIICTSKSTICTEMPKKKTSKLCKKWRPSLDAISETAILKATQKEAEEKARGKKVKVKGRVMIRTGCDDLRHFGPSMMQSFAPSAFIF